MILAYGPIVNTGSITAPGFNADSGSGGGGGAAGIIVLASATSITNSSWLSARGGTGGSGAANTGHGGGGGGGIINLIAPVIDDSLGTYDVDGGSGQSGGGLTVATAFRTGGGAGGSCGGAGGYGGDVAAATDGLPNYPYSSGDGTAGIYNTIIADPTSLY